MSRPITATPPLNKRETIRFLRNLEKDEKCGPVPTPKLKEAERKIREKYNDRINDAEPRYQ